LFNHRVDQTSLNSLTTDEESVQDVIVRLLADDEKLDEAARAVVFDALEQVVDQSDGNADTDWSSTFLSTIKVSGFRGIGSTAKLDLHPAPGLTVISGRNGSGKSSFAEALELALTGTSYRWRERQSLWSESWRNLHKPNPCAVRVDFAREGSGPVTVGVDWDTDAELADRALWTQSDGERVEGIDGLGWTHPLELYRPVLSYEELGRLFEGGPSVLYDALAKLLGLEALTVVEKKLAADLKVAKESRDAADAERRELLAALGAATDERAERVVKLLKKRPPPLDEIVAVVTGAGRPELNVVPALRALSELAVPPIDELEACASRLRSAVAGVQRTAVEAAALVDKRVGVLQSALDFHQHAGDTDCPVCGEGRLDADWAARTRAAIEDAETVLAEYRSATGELKIARQAADNLVAGFAAAVDIPGVELPGLQTYNDAAAKARALPDGDLEMAAHLESILIDAVGAAEVLHDEATAALADHEDAWAPLAAQVAAWVLNERQARASDDRLKAMNAAKKWVIDNGIEFRNMRLKPIAAQARQIWSQLRQESNVDLAEITLAGTATKRKAVLEGSVDGQPAQALSVMSQGEQNAVALALFLPRATSVKSPFRFVVLDDPIQAMDPAKIDGFVHILTDIASTHQVVVFSHDDRLASTVRQTGVNARLIEVIRETGSKVTARLNVDPAGRLVSDAHAMIKDEDLPPAVKSRVAPSLFRMALESIAYQVHFAKQSMAGQLRVAAEDEWEAARTTRTRLALAVLGDATADLTNWLHAKPHRKNALAIGNAGAHGAHGVEESDVSDLRRTVKDIVAEQ
jgi:recombinational DNA repair ATPase RecF